MRSTRGSLSGQPGGEMLRLPLFAECEVHSRRVPKIVLAIVIPGAVVM
jgi:hypothetical protein